MAKIEKEIQRKLTAIEIDIQQSKPFIEEYLVVIETIIHTISNDLVRFSENIKKNKISLSLISKEASISRQTLYNNPILKQYIEFSIDESKKNNPFDQIYELKKRISLLENDIKMLESRDLQTELLKHRNKEQTAAITIRNKEISLLRERNSDLVRRLNGK